MLRGRTLLALAVAGPTVGCAPSLQHLVETRRHADAICLASSAEEAAAVVAAVERDAAPSLNLYPVHASELTPLLGEAAARQTVDEVLLLRTQTAHGDLSVGRVDVRVMIKKQPKAPEDEGSTILDSLSLTSDGWRSLLSLTGEQPPPQARTVTEVDGQALGAAIFTLGLSRLFSSKPITRTVEVPATDAEWEAAGPRAAELARGLTGGRSVEGYLIRQEPGHEIHAEVTLAVSDYINDGGSCELRVWYELALPPLRPAAAPALDWMFGAQMRRVRELPLRERTYMLSNPFGHWRSPSQGGG